MKKYKELKFTDNFMFCKVLEENEELCKELTELLLGRKIGEIVKPESEKAIKLTPDGHGIRFDVYFEDDSDTMFDIEMQTTNKTNLPKRSRYYQGMMDLNYLAEGEKYERLPQSYIIFICNFDLFKLGYHRYSFRPKCNEVDGLELNDGTERVFICTGGDKADISKELSEFLEYIATGETNENQLVKQLEDEVQEAVKSEKWRTEYMTLREMMDDERERGQYELLVKMVMKKHQRGLDSARIAEDLMETEESIQIILDIMEKFAPDYDVEKIVDELVGHEIFELN